MGKIFLVIALSLLVLVLMNTVNVNGNGQLNPNPKCVIYNLAFGPIAEGKSVIVIDSNCPRHADTIVNYLGNYGYHIIAIIPTNNGSEVYMTNK